MPILADAERQRPGPEAAGVAEDLRRRVEGEVLFDSLHRTLYSTAACIYQVMPLGAVAARHEGDVLAVLEYARQNSHPITARGGGSVLAGQTLGRGIILDFSKYFQRIADIDATRGTVRVQPGVIQAQLNRVLRRHGMRFAPDPSSAPWCTLGGMLANNAGGSHTIKHGATRENTVSVLAALADGPVIDPVPLPLPGQGTLTPGPQARLASGPLEGRFVQVIRGADKVMGATLQDGTEAILIVELEGDDAKEVQDRMERLAAVLIGRRDLATDVRRAARPEDTARIWAVRKAASPILSRREGTRRNTRFIEDAAIHPAQMAGFVRRLRALLRKYGLQAAIFGHAGDCNLHCNPMLNQKDARDLSLMETMAEEFTDLVIGMGGSLSGEHGDGRLRTPYPRRAYGPLVDAFEKVKRLFDPQGILNPGIIVHDGSYGLTDNLRYGESYRRVPTATTIDDAAWQREIEKCHGCGACRNYCPLAAATGDEAATAPAKAKLPRAVISGRLH